MSLTPSTMLALGTTAPDFELPDTVSGRSVRLADLGAKKALLVMFLSNHCPYVQHVREELARVGRDYGKKDVAIVGICANDEGTHPADAPARMTEEARRNGWTFPYLHDASQTVAKAYTAACTPDFFLFDRSRRLVYRGQLDDSRPGTGKPVTGADLRRALDALLADRPLPADQRASLGCNIKWRSGNEPPYAR